MAMNPMQRKARNSFLFGFLIAIIVSAIIVGLLFVKIKGLNQEIEKMREKERIAMKDVYTVTQEVKAGESVRYLTTMTVAAEKAPANAITDDNLDDYAETNQKGEILTDSSGNISYQMKAKVAITPNTIMTTDMVEKSSEAGTYRMVECNMISLPSKLVTGDYIDVRLACPDGPDFIVLSKVKIEDSNASTIWLKLSEGQLMLLGSATLESYIIEGTKLYATQYANEAQAALNVTYVPNANAKNMIAANSLTNEDKEILENFETDTKNNNTLNVRNYIERILASYESERTSKVAEGFTAEKTAIQAARDALLGEMGY